MNIVEIDNDRYFQLANHDAMRPFFMSIVSDSNHWMFISSNGGLTAGRRDAEHALFPYSTDDKITQSVEHTGSKTIFRIQSSEKVHVWEPFSERQAGQYQIQRNLYKSLAGNKIIFEEINHNLMLKFSYQWSFSTRFGLVRKCRLINLSDHDCSIHYLDGLQNLLPYGVGSYLQMASSNLADAYKRQELHPETGLGIFSLSALIVDKAEPSEALKANTVWSVGLDQPGYLLSSLQLDQFRRGEEIVTEYDIKGEKGAYFVTADMMLSGRTERRWMIIANVNQSHSQVIDLCHAIHNDAGISHQIQEDIDAGTRNLLALVGSADGLQLTADPLQDARHFANVLFNILRGGTFVSNYEITRDDFISYLKTASAKVFRLHHHDVVTLGPVFTQSALYGLAYKLQDPDLIRLVVEYLPLHFSRRHGDPSRPWNKFTINTLDELSNTRILDYEGNWRDIFQNWEALIHAFPGFIKSMILKFLNATTFDGYNPYRITKSGFDWEIIEPDNPWSHIGYWGDHQIIYLLKFLEFLDQHQPGSFHTLCEEEVFVYANVPYRIKPYEEIRKDPRNTVIFNSEADHRIRSQIALHGADGALLMNARQAIQRVNFLEKLLAILLAKISNYIPGAGIWMNTQRPEWNDANNALVGYGTSLVTLCYLRRFLVFTGKMLARTHLRHIEISAELQHYFKRVLQILEDYKHLIQSSFDDIDRQRMTDALGEAGSDFRESIYRDGFKGVRSSIEVRDISKLCTTALAHFEHTIRNNQRDDRMYHAYNTISIGESGISISRLNEMLEGQVAVISAGLLGADEVSDTLKSLRNSALYREDQRSYTLYPNKALPGFMAKNSILSESVEKSPLLKKLVKDKNQQIIQQDIPGGFHFNGNFKNATDLIAALNELESSTYAPLVASDRLLVLDIFEEVFQHASFTGRSGTFYAYEGLGSIYWHMVSKLHLAVQEVCLQAINAHQNQTLVRQLINFYREIGEGIGVHKSPEWYGAFPTDPYSHTPWHKGAQQPGMTGQVKEDILVRFSELGVVVDDGALAFSPFLLKRDQFLTQQAVFAFINLKNEHDILMLEPGSLAFTICQTPVVYQLAQNESLEVRMKSGVTLVFDSTALDKQVSQLIFERTGDIGSIKVHVAEKHLLP
jgi:hypothetical protein